MSLTMIIVLCSIITYEVLVYCLTRDTHRMNAKLQRLIRNESFVGIRLYEAKNEWGVELRTKLEFGSTYTIYWGSTIEEAVTKALRGLNA